MLMINEYEAVETTTDFLITRNIDVLKSFVMHADEISISVCVTEHQEWEKRSLPATMHDGIY